MQQTVTYPQHTRKKCAAASVLALLIEGAAYGALCVNGGKCAGMGFRNSLGRTLLVLALALAVGIAVALMSADERTRTGHGSAPANEPRTVQRAR